VDLEGDQEVVLGSRFPPAQGVISAQLMIPFPDSFQHLPQAFGSGGDAQQVLSEQGVQAPELDPSSNRKNRPGQQQPEGVLHHLFNAHRSAPKPIESPTIVFHPTALRG